jgi:hypothetical protein
VAAFLGVVASDHSDDELARDLMVAIGSLGDTLLKDAVVVVEPGRVRVRRAR